MSGAYTFPRVSIYFPESFNRFTSHTDKTIHTKKQPNFHDLFEAAETYVPLLKSNLPAPRTHMNLIVCISYFLLYPHTCTHAHKTRAAIQDKTSTGFSKYFHRYYTSCVSCPICNHYTISCSMFTGGNVVFPVFILFVCGPRFTPVLCWFHSIRFVCALFDCSVLILCCV